jgi:hypothetical protein
VSLTDYVARFAVETPANAISNIPRVRSHHRRETELEARLGLELCPVGLLLERRAGWPVSPRPW